MPELELQFIKGAVCLPRQGLWLDAHHGCNGSERAFVSHAHSDHIGRHREAILTTTTARLMEARIGGKRTLHELAYHQPANFQGPKGDYRLTLRPAGHIPGSAMAFLETEAGSLLYTGDFKLRRGFAAEPCEPCHAESLIMETTFGLPRYTMPPAEQTWADIIRFCSDALGDAKIPVLLAYSLGKSQELLLGLGRAGLPVMLHEQAWKLTRICSALGQAYPDHREFDLEQSKGHVVICPPGTNVLTTLRESGLARTAVITGWAIDSSAKYRAQVDAAFPLSDHADFRELLDFVEQVRPKRVYTLHGFAAEFALTLRERGYDARALGVNEQLELGLFSAAIGGE